MDIRRSITDRVLAEMQKDGPPWRKAWHTTGGRPINAATGRPYSGINVLLLGMAMSDPQFSDDPRFLTFKQARKLRLAVRKGEKAAAHIVKMIELEPGSQSDKDATSEEVVSEQSAKRLVMRVYPVFHASQLDQPLPSVERQAPTFTPCERAESIAAGMLADGVKIVHGPYDPSYMPRIDTIRMPKREAFKGEQPEDVAAHFYGTLLHELAHSVGSPKRLSRFGLSAMTLRERAYEELVAEWSACLLAAECGGGGRPGAIRLGQEHVQQHAAYLSSWMEVLKEDKNAIFRAAAAAQRTCDYMIERAAKPEPKSHGSAQSPVPANEPVAQMAPRVPKRRRA